MYIKNGKKILGLSLSAAIAVSAFAGIGFASFDNKAYAAPDKDYGLTAVNEGVILHCFDWKLSDIKAELPNIAKAGFSSVQTSPLQGSPNQGVWYWLYQPLGFEIKDTGLGGEEELKSLCEEADKYGIKVIVDVVANHLAGNDREQLQKPFDQDIYWHNSGKKVSDSNRTAVTTYDLGEYGDLKSEDSTVIAAAKAYVEKLQSLGVDGIRWDAAKHIALPSEGCDFWSQVTDNSLFHYGEILGSPGGSNSAELMVEYLSYMNVTDNSYSDGMLSSFKKGKAPKSDGNWANKDNVSSQQLVYWGESHDTYANAKNSGSNGVDQNYVDRAYAVATSRKAVSLYLSRPLNSIPDQMMFGKKGSMHFTAPEIAAVNHFHNAAGSADDAYVNSDNVAVVTRKDTGAVIVLGEGGDKEVTVENVNGYVPAGTYKDEVTGNEFTVTATEIKGKVGSSGIAVVYDSPYASRVEASPETGTIFEGTLDVTLKAIGITDGKYTISNDNGIYSFTDGQVITIGEGVEGGTDIVLTLTGKNDAGEEVSAEYVYTKKVTKNLPKLTKGGVIFDNTLENWSKVNVYVYDERTTKGIVVNNADWPGAAMTNAGDGLFTYEFPDKFKDCKNIMVIFNNGAGNQLPAKDGFLCGYNEVGYYEGEEQLKVVQTFSNEEQSQTSEQSQNSEVSQTSQTSQNSEESQNSQTSNASSQTSQNSQTNSKPNSNAASSAVSNTTQTITARDNPIVDTGDARPFAVVAAIAAISAAVVAFTAKKKREQD